MSDPKYVPTEDSSFAVKFGYLVGELGEALAEAGRCIRFGFCAVNPELLPQEQETNWDAFLRELGDVRRGMELVKHEQVGEGSKSYRCALDGRPLGPAEHHSLCLVLEGYRCVCGAQRRVPVVPPAGDPHA